MKSSYLLYYWNIGSKAEMPITKPFRSHMRFTFLFSFHHIITLLYFLTCNFGTLCMCKFVTTIQPASLNSWVIFSFVQQY